MLQTLLVPMDCSAFGDQALSVASGLAARAKAKVHLLHVHRPLAEVHPEFAPYFDDEKLTGEIKTRQREYLDRAAGRLAKRGVEAVCVLKEGPTAAVIEDYAKQQKVDMVVMSTHGRGAVARFWLGSVADELVRKLEMPLLLIRPDGQTTEAGGELPLKRLLIALDGSTFSEQIVEPAIEVAQLVEAEIVLLRVIKPFVPEHYSLEGVGHLAAGLVDQLEKLEAEARKEADTYLERIANRCRAKLVKASKQVVLAEDPASAILERGTPPAVDLIGLATHGRRGLSRLFLGSVADKIVRGSTVPVLIYRPHGG